MTIEANAPKTDTALTSPASLTSLQGVSRTLLIPLFARAHASKLLPGTDFEDPMARELVASSPLSLRDVSRDLFPMRLCIARKILIEQILGRWLAQAPRHVVLLACGLDTLPQRFAESGATWLCADLPHVIEARSQLLPPTPHFHHRDATLPALPEDIKRHTTQTAPIIILEGILPYLSPEDVAHCFANLIDACPHGADVIVDSYHPSLLAFAQMGATFRRMQVGFRFGLRQPQEYTQFSQRLVYKDSWDLLTLLPWYYRKRCLFPQIAAGRLPLSTISYLQITPDDPNEALHPLRSPWMAHK